MQSSAKQKLAWEYSGAWFSYQTRCKFTLVYIVRPLCLLLDLVLVNSCDWNVQGALCNNCINLNVWITFFLAIFDCNVTTFLFSFSCLYKLVDVLLFKAAGLLIFFDWICVDSRKVVISREPCLSILPTVIWKKKNLKFPFNFWSNLDSGHESNCYYFNWKQLWDTDQRASTTANPDEALLAHASLALACRGWGPGAQQQRRGSWTSRGSQLLLLLLLLLTESLDLLWRYRDGLTRTMRGVTQRDTTDRGSGGQGRDIKSTKAKDTHRERKAQGEIISPKFGVIITL